MYVDSLGYNTYFNAHCYNTQYRTAITAVLSVGMLVQYCIEYYIGYLALHCIDLSRPMLGKFTMADDIGLHGADNKLLFLLF